MNLGKREKAASRLKRKILEENLPQGSRLPSVRKLASLLGISTRTTNLVLKDLEKEGILESRQRTGVFVKTGPKAASQESDLELIPEKSKPELIAEELARQISNGNLRVGEHLPLRKALKFEFGASSSTLSKALLIAEKRSLIHRIGSKFVIGARGVPSHQTDKKVYLVPAWSAKLKREVRGITKPEIAFARSMEVELVSRDVTYIGRFGPLMMKRKGAALRSKSDAFGYFYPLTEASVKSVADVNQFWMEKELSRLNRLDSPVVLYNATYIRNLFPQLSFRPFKNLSVFLVDNHGAGETCAQYLHRLGHMQVAYFSCSTRAWNEHRKQGLANGLARASRNAARIHAYQADIPIRRMHSVSHQAPELLEVAADFAQRFFRGYKYRFDPIARKMVTATTEMIISDLHRTHMTPLFSQALLNREVTAWVCADSLVALCAADFLARNDVHPPERISLLAIDDDATLSDHAITGCDLQRERMGYLAAHCILEDIPIRRDRSGVVECPARIVDRGSVARA